MQTWELDQRALQGLAILLMLAVPEIGRAQPGGVALPGQTSSVTQARTPRSGRQAEVDFTGGVLRVSANNSSLNQILREIGRQTGMKITGGVQEDRVFGQYGPAPAGEVLAKLLDGTPANFLIVDNDRGGPAELILTPRQGGATPPNPNAVAMGDTETDQPVPPPPQQIAQPSNDFSNGTSPGRPPGSGGIPPSNGGQTGTPIDGGANLGTTPGAFAGFGQTPANETAQPPAAANPAEPQSPNGVSTPQQIYEQLQKLRQQQQQQQNSTTSPR